MENFSLIGGVLAACLGAVTDIRNARIPNRLTYSALATALVLRTAVLGLSGLKSGAASMLVAGGLCYILFLLGAMGGGDVKLMAAVGAWVGSTQVVTLLLTAAMAGGVLAIVYIIFRGIVGQTLRNVVQLIWYGITSGPRPHPVLNIQSPESRRVPFGVAIAAGALFCAGNAFWRR